MNDFCPQLTAVLIVPLRPHLRKVDCHICIIAADHLREQFAQCFFNLQLFSVVVKGYFRRVVGVFNDFFLVVPAVRNIDGSGNPDFTSYFQFRLLLSPKTES